MKNITTQWIVMILSIILILFINYLLISTDLPKLRITILTTISALFLINLGYVIKETIKESGITTFRSFKQFFDLFK